jgi:hypothetical protein
MKDKFCPYCKEEMLPDDEYHLNKECLKQNEEFLQILTIREVISRISKRHCLICLKNLDMDLRKDWHIPLCQKHRLAYWKEVSQ